MVAINRLTAMQVKKSGAGKFADGAGLWLHRRTDGGAQWFLRYVIYGKRREMGLGSLDNVTLKEARKLAEEWRTVVREGNDPIKVRDKRQREEAKDENTLEYIAKEAFESRKAELKGNGTAGRWFSPLELHILPKLGKFPVEEIDQKDIKNALQPIWHSKGETARKAINRLGIVLKYAAALELDVDIQAVDKAKMLLGKSRQQSKKIPALHWKEVPAFYQNLGNSNISELALRLLILTGVRSGPLRFARWEQIDGDVWTIPAENMKGRVGEVEDFEVPLSKESHLVLERVRPFERDGFIFPGQRKGVMSDVRHHIV